MNNGKYIIRFASGGVVARMDDEGLFEAMLDEIVEELPYDIDVRGAVAVIDDGDFDEDDRLF
jgi:hypothetical protein